MLKHYEPAELIELGPAESLVQGDKLDPVSDGGGTSFQEIATAVDVDE